ncbi:ABC transporter ATP-binding protein [Bacillus litorisediminis]|uniref:ABC transporter ATP-binding protein n=1 Tax=Bacillus litorisediminis TaxID=2922713 RepID=UPI001FAE1848|nr:ABC transporter ATP-binding protein [Bacillus litorisediminis]
MVNGLINVQDVKKKYGKHESLKGISFSIEKGEVFGLIGPNGAGKSTLLSIMATILQPTAGTIIIDGKDVKKQAKDIRRRLGFVPQDLALWPELTVEENMIFWSKLTNPKVDKSELLGHCEQVGLKEKWKTKVSALSGGMKRKLNIAVALIHQPSIIIMDEPTVGIDIQSKRDINHYIQHLAKAGKTIVYTTHDAGEILRMCDRIGILNQGELKFIGTISQAMEKADSESLEDVLCTIGEW